MTEYELMVKHQGQSAADTALAAGFIDGSETHVLDRPRPAYQPSLLEPCPIAAAVEKMAVANDEERGAIFTRREVVEFILDLVGYTKEAPLHRMRLLEPSAGDGDFLCVAIERLLSAAKREGWPLAKLHAQIRVVELHHETWAGTRERVEEVLRTHGASADLASELAATWVIQGDFLLAEFDQSFTHVVGNPPYLRQELIPNVLLAEYRRRYSTLYDRADLYIPFIERSLELLERGGALGFICADRWMKNKYGGPLRQLVAQNHWLRFHVDMMDTPAFHSDVIAYPAVTVIQKFRSGPTRIVRRPPIESVALSEISAAMLADTVTDARVIEVSGVASGREPWVLEDFDRLALVRRLEATFPTLEEAGCKVGIGVATGADEVFIGDFEDLDVEAERKLPLVMRSDIVDGQVQWRRRGVINPFLSDGRLADFDKFPKFGAYISARRHEIDRRHVAQKNPNSWYRTIDRIYPELAAKPKLLIPDIAGKADIVFEDRGLYPHHNLYFVTSTTWDLRALRALLISGIATMFIRTYSTKMRGGYLRFQAQYLRRIRVPAWVDVPPHLKDALIDASSRGDLAACNAAAIELYGLDASEQGLLAAGH